MDKIYLDGFFASEAQSEKQREFIISRCAINVNDFKAFLDKQKPDDKGYVRFDLKRSMKDPSRFYGELNTYVSKQSVTSKDHSPDRDSDLPF